MGWLDRFRKQDAPEASPVQAEPVKLSAKPDLRGMPGSRIYHEYFVAAEPVDGKYPWNGRVYASDGTAYENASSAETRMGACLDALAWAEEMKTKLRGTP